MGQRGGAEQGQGGGATSVGVCPARGRRDSSPDIGLPNFWGCFCPLQYMLFGGDRLRFCLIEFRHCADGVRCTACSRAWASRCRGPPRGSTSVSPTATRWRRPWCGASCRPRGAEWVGDGDGQFRGRAGASEVLALFLPEACDPPATDAQIAEVKAYFLGLPSAYMPFLVNKAGGDGVDG